ncbi:MAG: hypothetical protein PHD20_02755 [Clostridia bacterium]|nr:hypothetical protein [Clostridia bacterium]
MKTYNQAEILELINQYNSTDRKLIKLNYKRILEQYSIMPKEIMELGYQKNNVYSWSTKSSPNIPMFDQALTISVAFNFPVEEFLKEI